MFYLKREKVITHIHITIHRCRAFSERRSTLIVLDNKQGQRFNSSNKLIPRHSNA